MHLISDVDGQRVLFELRDSIRVHLDSEEAISVSKRKSWGVDGLKVDDDFVLFVVEEFWRVVLQNRLR